MTSSSSTKPAIQSSILSFFQPKPPKDISVLPSNSILPSSSQPSPVLPVTTTPLSPIVSPHPSATIRRLLPHDVPALRRVNALLLPIPYPDRFYRAALESPYSRVITWAEPGSDPAEAKVVGGIVCRLDPSPFHLDGTLADPAKRPALGRVEPTSVGVGADGSDDAGARDGQPTKGLPRHALYIQSLCILSPYRSLGLATTALDDILRAATADLSLAVHHAYAHVWTENTDGLGWYRARDFCVIDPVLDSYYTKLRPGSAWVVRRDLQRPFPPETGSQASPATTTAKTATSRSGGSNAAENKPPLESARSFQKTRPGMEWNDLPEEMMAATAAPRPGDKSSASSRSTSSAPARKKRDRAYPAAAFNNS